MTTRDSTFDNLGHNKKLDMASSQQQQYLHYTPWQRNMLRMSLKAKKKKAEATLKANREGLAEAKKVASEKKKRRRSTSAPKTSKSTVVKDKMEKAQKGHK